jgi:hypothetical protein
MIKPAPPAGRIVTKRSTVVASGARLDGRSAPAAQPLPRGCTNPPEGLPVADVAAVSGRRKALLCCDAVGDGGTAIAIDR